MSLYEHATSVTGIGQWAVRGRLFAIVDATGTPSVPIKVRELGPDRAVSLYRGRPEEDLWAIAPYLVRLDGETLEWLAATLWSEPWGFFIFADADLESLRVHFRRFLVVESPEKESWYFRFYDPRVLVKYLRTLSETELVEFVGPARALGVTDPVSYGVRVFGTSKRLPGAGQTTQPVVIRRA